MLLQVLNQVSGNKWWRRVLFILSSISAFIYPLIKFRTTFFARDWGLFNSLSLFNHSAWLHYKTLPQHNPYIEGGMDVFANPQARALSPMSVLDVLFIAPYANLLSLLILSVIGAFGFYRLLRHLNINGGVAVLITIIYSHATWFVLHFSEGHIIFGNFQLFGWVYYFILNIEKERAKILLSLLLSFFLLDGSIYAFIYSLVLLLFSLTFKLNNIGGKIFLQSIVSQKKISFYALFIFVSIGGAKLIPFLLLHYGRDPVLENITLNGTSVLHAFFDPFQYVTKQVVGGNYKEQNLGFHEIGSYIGIGSLIILIVYLLKSKQRSNYTLLLVIAIFFWIGTGFFPSVNPWRIWQKILLFNNAHVQTRVLFFVYFFSVILLAKSLDYFLVKINLKLMNLIVLFLILESIYISNYAYWKLMQDPDSISGYKNLQTMICNTTIEKTIFNPSDNWGFDFVHFKRKNIGTKNFMDPAIRQGEIKTIDDADYKGEIYTNDGIGEVKLLSFIPGQLELSFKNVKSNIFVNTNWLLRWKCENKGVKVFSERGLITIQPFVSSGTVKLKYSPYYTYPILILYLIGGFSLLFVLPRTESLDFAD